jgi:hypothetical protein
MATTEIDARVYCEMTDEEIGPVIDLRLDDEIIFVVAPGKYHKISRTVRKCPDCNEDIDTESLLLTRLADRHVEPQSGCTDLMEEGMSCIKYTGLTEISSTRDRTLEKTYNAKRLKYTRLADELQQRIT